MIPVALMDDVQNRVPHIILTVADTVEDLPTCTFYASTAVGNALGLPGSSSRFGRLLRSTHGASGAVALLHVWPAEGVPVPLWERRRLASTGWQAEYTKIR